MPLVCPMRFLTIRLEWDNSQLKSSGSGWSYPAFSSQTVPQNCLGCLLFFTDCSSFVLAFLSFRSGSAAALS